ncbi:MAG: hypothetical protein GXO64_02760 [Candidatus Micrarchaeota archaeon]|nr:hypothetical protein [Candidatus Micrarchaeota archaeon]
MGLPFFKKKVSKRQELLEEISNSKSIKKKDFIEWLRKQGLNYSFSMSWDEIIDELENRKSITNKKIEQFIKKKERERNAIKENKKRKLHEALNDKIAKGHIFEKKIVAPWAKRYFKADSVKTNDLAIGFPVKRPHEIDVHITIKKSFGKKLHILVECKNRKSSIKRRDISNLIKTSESVLEAFENKKEDFYFEREMFVSTSKYDSDALLLAEEYDIACFQFINGKMKLINSVSWL